MIARCIEAVCKETLRRIKATKSMQRGTMRSRLQVRPIRGYRDAAFATGKCSASCFPTSSTHRILCLLMRGQCTPNIEPTVATRPTLASPVL
eukprot:3914395-Amphidinium_carterae.1